MLTRQRQRVYKRLLNFSSGLLQSHNFSFHGHLHCLINQLHVRGSSETICRDRQESLEMVFSGYWRSLRHSHVRIDQLGNEKKSIFKNSMRFSNSETFWVNFLAFFCSFGISGDGFFFWRQQKKSWSKKNTLNHFDWLSTSKKKEKRKSTMERKCLEKLLSPACFSIAKVSPVQKFCGLKTNQRENGCRWRHCHTTTRTHSRWLTRTLSNTKKNDKIKQKKLIP